MSSGCGTARLTLPRLCRGILPLSSRSVLNHSQQVGGPTGQTGGMVGGERGGASAGVGAARSSSIGSPSRGSPSIIGMAKQQQARQPFTINRCTLAHTRAHARSALSPDLTRRLSFPSMSGFGVNRNPGFNMNNSLSNNIFNGTGTLAVHVRALVRLRRFRHTIQKKHDALTVATLLVARACVCVCVRRRQ